MAVSFVTVIESLQEHVQVGGPFWILIKAICYTMAIVFAMVSLGQLKEVADGQRHSYKAPIMTFFAAVLMATFLDSVASVLSTMYTTSGGVNPLSYVKSGDQTKTFKALTSFVTFIGYCFFIRGIWVLKESGEPQRFQGQTVGKAITIMFAGVAAIYIDQTLKILANTFGFNLDYYLN